MPAESRRLPSNVLFCLSVSALLRNGRQEIPTFGSNIPAYVPGYTFGDLLQLLRSKFGWLWEELKGCCWLACGAAEYGHIDPSNPDRYCKGLHGFQVYDKRSQLAPVITEDAGHGFRLAWDSSHTNINDEDDVKPESLPVIVLYIQRYKNALGVVSCRI
jgi:hypothetical protein